MTNKPEWLADRVSYGNDGKNLNPPEQDGPALLAVKQMLAQFKVDTKNAYLEALKEQQQAALASLPNLVPIGNSAVMPASGTETVVIDLGGPQLGRRWLIRLLRVSDGVNVTSSVTGKANWFVGNVTAASNFSPQAWAWTMSSLPAVQNFTSESIGVKPSDHLFCVVSSGTASQVVSASALILDYDALCTSGVPVI